jgi:hypothetical protein
MSQTPLNSNTVAPLTNVRALTSLIERAKSRDPRLPGMVCFHGPSGWGKSSAASYAYLQPGTHYIECRSTMTKKTFLEDLCKEMGILPERTIGGMYSQIVSELEGSERVLIVDEMDYLVQKSAVDIIRDIHDQTGVPVALIGEEHLPSKLKRWERFHGRILAWGGAQPVTLSDVVHLAGLYCPEIHIANDLLEKIHQLAKGSVRRVCVNLAQILEVSHSLGVDQIGLAEWADRPFYTGEAPAGRRF